jgi:hypothetical protein
MMVGWFKRAGALAQSNWAFYFRKCQRFFLACDAI